MEINIETNELEKRLIKLITIPHGKIKQEDNVRSYIKKHIPEIQEDSIGNLYLINPDTPLVCAHMDNVGGEIEQMLLKNLYVGPLKDTTKVHFKGIMGEGNLGADDKCGIAIAMELYKLYGDKISLLFTVGEEVGCVGSTAFCKDHKDLVESCTYAIIPDRRNGFDFIGEHNGYCHKDFQNKVMTYIGKETIFCFEPVRGLCSDANHTAKIINSFNISVGYYCPHTNQEYIDLVEFNNTFDALCYLIENFNERMPIYVAPVYNYKPYSWGDFSCKSKKKQTSFRDTEPEDDDDSDVEYTPKWWEKYQKKEVINGDEIDIDSSIDIDDGIYSYQEKETLVLKSNDILEVNKSITLIEDNGDMIELPAGNYFYYVG